MPTLRTVYVDEDIDQKIKSIAFTRGENYSDVLTEVIASGILAFDATGERSIRDEMDERHRLMIQFRKDKLDELTSLIDAEFDSRWKKIKAAIDSVYPKKAQRKK